MSKIEWTGRTWNPITGCTKKSPGCDNCYAERMAARLKAMPNNKRYENGFELTIHDDLFEKPHDWKKPRMVFVCSMSDIFHEKVTLSTLNSIFGTIWASQHTYQILTKRSTRLLELSSGWPFIALPNIWMGVTVESSAYKDRIDDLRLTRAKTKFISFEPLLDDVGPLNLDGIDWVIVGGESGPNARPMNEDWVLSIKNQCVSAGVPFFFKQWGGKNKKKAGRLLEGEIWEQMPEREGARG